MAERKRRAPATYTSFWGNWRCAQAAARGLEGAVINRVWGGWNQGTHYGTMLPGDRVVLVGLLRGCVYVFGRLDIDEVVTPEVWLASVSEVPPHACASSVIVGSKGTRLRFDVALPGAYLEGWSFETVRGDPRPFKAVENGLVKRGTQIQTTVRVTMATAQRLHQFIDHGDLQPSPEPRLAKLENKLHRKPDEDTMSVYVDALLDAGDIRGEIAVLERTLTQAEARATRKKLWRLGTKHLPALGGRPGGFPFRTNWGLRRVEPK